MLLNVGCDGLLLAVDRGIQYGAVSEAGWSASGIGRAVWLLGSFPLLIGTPQHAASINLLGSLVEYHI